MMIKDLKLRLGASSDSLQIRHQLAQLCQRDAHSPAAEPRQANDPLAFSESASLSLTQVEQLGRHGSIIKDT